MNLLLLGDKAINLPVLEGNTIHWTKDKLNFDWLKTQSFDWLISYGYRYIIKKPVLDLFGNRAINLHISYLPWNRGADPNYWAWKDKTPHGVTIHVIDEGIDTGPIICQTMISMKPEDHTLKTSYEYLHETMIKRFTEVWKYIDSMTPFKQQGISTFHHKSDKPDLPYGNDTPCWQIVDK